MRGFLGILTLFLVFMSCSKKNTDMISEESSDLEILLNMMTGYYNSAEQASQDSSFFDISLNMHQIWTDRTDAKWIYVEQAVSANIQKPYRQRVYRLSQNGGTFESKVYELPTPEKYVHAWKESDKFKSLNPEDLTEREGCTAFLAKRSDGCYTGSTEKGACLSSLRGATYATSSVEICNTGIESWDQGWNDKDEQVWGAVKSGYIFNKIK